MKSYVHCHGISGAGVETILEQIRVFDLKNFSTVIVSVGGNDVSNCSNLEYVEEKYDQLLIHIRAANPDCQIVMCTVCPRQDCDVSELNDILNQLSTEHNVQLVNMEKQFCGPDGNPTLRYYGKDRIHLSKSGVRRFLDSIEKGCEDLALVDNFQLCVFGRPPSSQAKPQHNQRQFRHSGRHGQINRQSAAPFRDRTQKCVKCGENNHSTFDCKHKEQIKCHSCGYFGHKQSKCPNK